MRLAGVDEAGRGPWAGPVVAAAVVLPPHPRFTARIADSKKLSPAQREQAFGQILIQSDVGVGIASAQEIDRLNILQATFLAMQRALDTLAQPPTRVLVDGALTPRLAVPCEALIGGDGREPAISCASIIAKVTRDRLMRYYHTIWPEYQLDEHKGYGTPAHLARLHAHGPSFLHRRSFAPVALLVEAAVRPPAR